MPDFLHGADRRTVAATPEPHRFTRSFAHRTSPEYDAATFLAQYREACAETDRLFAAVLPDFLTSRPVPERHRLLFYIGHLEAFDWNLLAPRAFQLPSFHPEFDRLFAFGIDPVGGGLPTDVPADWPSMAAIRRYRDTVRDRIETALAHVDFSKPVQRVPQDRLADAAAPALTSPAEVPLEANPSERQAETGDVSVATLCLVALEHRQMHAETLAYLIHQMPYAQKRRPDDASDGDAPTLSLATPIDGGGRSASIRTSGDAQAEAPMCAVPAGVVIRGLPGRFDRQAEDAERAIEPQRVSEASAHPAGQRFGWDNEWVDPAAAAVAVPAFEIDRWMVSNGAFLRFVDAGGYDEAQWWRPEDWAWREAAGIAHPAFWERDASAPNGWCWRGMFAAMPLPLDWPVYVSRAEASAYARFVGKRLPSEAEWLRAADGVPGLPDASMQADVAAAAKGFTGNADFRRWDPDAVDAHPANRSRFGVEGQFGNGWEWTGDPFAPFHGFTPFPFYRGYSADFFDDRHFVMKGGSPRTAARMLRPSFRNWFQAHYPYVYAGFRCAR